ncbi:hypothetical protein PS623_03947 [Pseudomonas fluorescens]|nr:hypothetical protein PS623_03947 [Pseudomonas fluorescens]
MQRLAQAHRIEHVRQAVVAVLQQGKQRCGRRQAASGKQLVEKFQLMGEVADRGDFDHARAALERMQVAQQGLDLDTAARVGLPAGQRCRRAFDDVRAFFEEHLE